MSEELRVTVWKGKYMTQLVESYDHFLLRPSCDMNMPLGRFCTTMVIWAVSYSVYDHNYWQSAERIWFGLKDGTIVHMWTHIDNLPLSMWCYEYYDLEEARQALKKRMAYEKYDLKLRLTRAKVAGDVPPEIRRTVESYTAVEEVALVELCPE
jgi:hypothetical protein